MKYKIVRDAMSLPGEILLTPDEYARIRLAKRQLIVFLGIEEKFDLLLENYAEYERCLYELAFHRLLYRDLDWVSAQGDRQLVNRRLSNLLSAARLYLDQIGHDLAILYDADVEVVTAVKDESKKQYDTKLGYRVMEALRNYAQHRSLPVHGLSYPARVEEPLTAQAKTRYGVVPFLNTVELEQDESIKQRIIDELRKKSPQIPLTPLVREYVEGLGAVHEMFRTQTKTDVESADDAIAMVEQRARNAFSENALFGLAVVAENEENEGVWTEVDHIFDDLVKRRRILSTKNGLLNKLSLRGSIAELGRRKSPSSGRALLLIRH